MKENESNEYDIAFMGETCEIINLEMRENKIINFKELHTTDDMDLL